MATPSPVDVFVAALARCQLDVFLPPPPPNSGRPGSRFPKLEFHDIPDDTVRALSKLFRNLVTLVDDEILIENLEGFPPDKRPVQCHLEGIRLPRFRSV
jgi:hypothetical protein